MFKRFKVKGLQVHKIECEYEWVNNITTCDDGDVVRRGATNIFSN